MATLPITIVLPEFTDLSVTSQCLTLTNADTTTVILNAVDLTMRVIALDLDYGTNYSLVWQEKVSGVNFGPPGAYSFNSSNTLYQDPTILPLCGAPAN